AHGNSATAAGRRARSRAAPGWPRCRPAPAARARFSRLDAPRQVLVARAVLLHQHDAHRKMAAVGREPELGDLARSLAVARDLDGVELARRRRHALASRDLIGM